MLESLERQHAHVQRHPIPRRNPQYNNENDKQAEVVQHEIDRVPAILRDRGQMLLGVMNAVKRPEDPAPVLQAMNPVQDEISPNPEHCCR